MRKWSVDVYLVTPTDGERLHRVSTEHVKANTEKEANDIAREQAIAKTFFIANAEPWK